MPGEGGRLLLAEDDDVLRRRLGRALRERGFDVHEAASAPEAARLAAEADLSHALVDLRLGEGSATIRTTDLSHAYVEENSAYSS